MRITFTMLGNSTLTNLNNQQEQISTLSEQISSGTTLASPSDDPYAWAQSMNVNQGVREYNSFLSNITFATGWGNSTESSLNQLTDLISQAKQIAISASSTNGSTQASAYAGEVTSILNQAVTLANSQYGSQYVFSGTETTSAPYSIDSSTGAVTYNGDSNYIQVKTSATVAAQGGSTTVNVTGPDVFTYTSGGNTLNVLQEIWKLGQEIQNGDTSGINTSMTTLDDAYTHVNDELTTVGSRLASLDSQKTAINTFITNEKSTLSSLQDTDLAGAATKLAQAKTAYQAALQVSSSLANLNLASYLSGSGG